MNLGTASIPVQCRVFIHRRVLDGRTIIFGIDIQKAILIELFGILVILFAGINMLTNMYLFDAWDLIGDMRVWLVIGLFIGVSGVIVGLR